MFDLKKICACCEREIPEEARYCPYCGADLRPYEEWEEEYHESGFSWDGYGTEESNEDEAVDAPDDLFSRGQRMQDLGEYEDIRLRGEQENENHKGKTPTDEVQIKEELSPESGVLKKCPGCGKIVNVQLKSKFCPNCKSKLPTNIVICPNCREENLADDKVCHSCGTSLQSSNSWRDTKEENTWNKEKLSMNLAVENAKSVADWMSPSSCEFRFDGNIYNEYLYLMARLAFTKCGLDFENINLMIGKQGGIWEFFEAHGVNINKRDVYEISDFYYYYHPAAYMAIEYNKPRKFYRGKGVYDSRYFEQFVEFDNDGITLDYKNLPSVKLPWTKFECIVNTKKMIIVCQPMSDITKKMAKRSDNEKTYYLDPLIKRSQNIDDVVIPKESIIGTSAENLKLELENHVKQFYDWEDLPEPEGEQKFQGQTERQKETNIYEEQTIFGKNYRVQPSASEEEEENTGKSHNHKFPWLFGLIFFACIMGEVFLLSLVW